MVLRFIFICACMGILYSYEGSPDDIFLQHGPIFISIGSQCEVSTQISQNAKRDASFVFDWILSVDIEGIIQVLNNRLDLFFDERYFKIHPYHSNVLIHQLYNFEYRHDWNQSFNFWNDFYSFRITYENSKITYERRIDRFKRLNQYKGKVFFVRSAFDINTEPQIVNMFSREYFEITSLQAIRLRNALADMFPLLNFELVIINFEEQLLNKIKINETSIRSFVFSRNNKNDNYKEMFSQLINNLD